MRFFIKEHMITGAQSVLIEDADMVKHISKSLRMREKEEIELCLEGRKIYDCVIEKIDRTIRCRILQEREIEPQRVRVDLFQAIVKSNHWDYLIQKNVEFGISSITPVSTIRCVAKYEEKSEAKKIDRLQKIAESASQQSFRDFIPSIGLPISFEGLKERIASYNLFLVAYENERYNGLHPLAEELQKSTKIGLLIGPEGGFEKGEIEELLEFPNVRVITLGRRILRTESAGAYLLAQINYILEIQSDEKMGDK